MSRRRFEMFQYRQVIVRLRQGDTDREIARSRLMGRRKITALRPLATEFWLVVAGFAVAGRCDNRGGAVPGTACRQHDFDGGAIPGASRAVGRTGRRRHRDPAALKCEHGYTGSYSAVRRMVAGIRAAFPRRPPSY